MARGEATATLPERCPSCDGVMAAGSISGGAALWWLSGGSRERLAVGWVEGARVPGRRCEGCGLAVVATQTS